jgi:GntR family transcriptional regulator, transcriptional repressor for pyruvate dehydrogenase complex
MDTPETYSGQEQCLEIRLRAQIAAGVWAPGQRLPAERQMAEDYGVSRNTLRGALRRLEAQRVVAIRRGSGCYLLSADPSPRDVAEEESFSKVMARFEAAYLFLPGMVALAAQRMTADHLVRLEQCTAELGRAIVIKEREGIKDRTREFFRLIAAATANPVIGELVIPFCASSSVMFPEFYDFGEAERNKMFADIVHILRALKRHDAVAAMTSMRCKIVNTSVAFSELKQIPLSPVIEAARAESP